MHREELIIVFDKMTSSQVRIVKLFSEQGIKVEDVKSQIELMNVLLQNEDKKNVLIMAIDEEITEDGIELIRKIKPLYPDLSILVLTSISKREFFAKCIAEGVVDYILKPYEDYMLLERTQKLLDINHNTTDSVLKFNFPGYLRSEILKAKKGKYQFTLLKSTIFSIDGEGYSAVDIEFGRYSNLIYEKLNALFWETDIFIQYGGDSFLGFFPFCGEENCFLIDDKVKHKFHEMREQNASLKKYEIINAFVTFPGDGDDVKQLLNELTSKVERAAYLQE